MLSLEIYLNTYFLVFRMKLRNLEILSLLNEVMDKIVGSLFICFAQIIFECLGVLKNVSTPQIIQPWFQFKHFDLMLKILQ